MNKFINILLCATASSWASTYLISNGGQASSGFVAVYDAAAKNSVLIGGYSDPASDNGHCAQGNISGEPITIIVPTSLAKFGYISENCTGSSSSGAAYNASCQNGSSLFAYCDTEVTAGAPITTQSVNYNLCSSTPPSGGDNQKITINGQVFYCPITEQTLTLQVSPICQSISQYFQSNFAVENDTSFKTVEYASCDTGATSYCSVTFTPKEFQLRIDTDLLGMSNNYQPGVCKQTSNGNLSCSFVMSPSKETNTCGFAINDPSYGQGLSALNSWLSQNLTAINSPSPFSPVEPLPMAYFQNCTGISANSFQGYLNQITQNWEDNENQIIQERLSPLRAQLNKLTSGTAAYTALSEQIRNNYIRLTKQFSSVFARAATAQINDGFPCLGTYSTDENGNLLVVYSCSTQFYNPNYTCSIVYTASNIATSSNPQFSLTSSVCNFPLDNFVFQSPTLGDPAFNCGFCGNAEVYSVGNNKQDIDIETGIGTQGQLFPFVTDGYVNPTCLNGFISHLTPELYYNNQESLNSNVFSESNGVLMSNLSTQPYNASVFFGANSLYETYTMNPATCTRQYTKGDIPNGLSINNIFSVPLSLGGWAMINQQGWAYLTASNALNGNQLFAVLNPTSKIYNCYGSSCNDVTEAINMKWPAMMPKTEQPNCS